ncbi:hypothetical protein LTS17_000134 [Exophiala oligosperma]
MADPLANNEKNARDSSRSDPSIDAEKGSEKPGRSDSSNESRRSDPAIQPLQFDANRDYETHELREEIPVLERIYSTRSEVSRIQNQPPELPLTDLDHGIVGWEGPDDPENPLNFAWRRKMLLLLLTSAMSFVSPLASSMFAPAAGFMAREFDVKQQTLLAFSVSVYVLGYAFGPLVLAPMSEICGRRIVLTCTNIFFVAWQIGCARAPNIGLLVFSRFMAGIGGSGCLTVGAGLIADMFPVAQRGMATSIWSAGPLFGPVVGPICGGFIAQQAGWRWVFWVLLIAGGVATVGIELLNKETYARVLIRWKTQRLAKELGRNDLISWYDRETGPVSPQHALRIGMLRPLQMLVKSPIVFVLSLYMSIAYGLMYLLFTTITEVFEGQYKWSPQMTGLAYLGLGIGFFIGAAIVALSSDRMVVRLMERNGGEFQPEMRMPLMIFFACFIPISFFWYGWAADKKVQWIVPIIGLAPFGFGMIGIFLPIQTYLIDCYPTYAASAVATLTATRSLVGAVLPLAGSPMYKSLTLGWGNSLLGFIALACIPIPLVLERFGKRIREKSTLKLG